MLGGEIEVTILESQGEQVKIGIKAPRHLKIYRKEVYEQIVKENQEAIESVPSSFEGFKNLLK